METQLGTRFAEAIAAKDSAALLSVLAPDVDFRALTPGRFWEASTAAEVVDDVILGHWFEPSDTIDSLYALEAGTVVDRHSVAYRFAVTNADGTFTVEQQAYFDVVDDRIGWMRVICSGYRPVAPATG